MGANERLSVPLTGICLSYAACLAAVSVRMVRMLAGMVAALRGFVPSGGVIPKSGMSFVPQGFARPKAWRGRLRTAPGRLNDHDYE